ncbi:MAG TPA: MAPEG family protein [Polyangiaceae bacterium LLY-WYZ-15_(1-7)]|nr:hypothetical protein [Sandaracinus sp.]HJK89363.1 MAPEG family protein [Polyangiaceae bacterium LLY-WYZ-15_(1-7)]MBJ74002.1 hypothetical protein [Sandaracinus sp.]HJL03021.1 MAPEG family protein [Polyangiaceae bacterium LLY-WYZ-15_(1-7)]HJL13591.1 MAPEG family protein [Polyangiaceae bacterium LLY-WYZ-15_(1-7)]|tara:strand:+ start:325 stop:750 length:426 start_codon:yes stop_codon:yes gene_type:complete
MEDLLATQSLALWALLALVAMVLLQSLVAAGAHRSQKTYVPGVVDEELGHESFVFRSHRTFMNSLENLPMMVPAIVLGLLVGLDPLWLGALSWAYVGARALHMALYYAIATEKNPSPRSWFYMLGLLANVVLLGKLAVHMA